MGSIAFQYYTVVGGAIRRQSPHDIILNHCQGKTNFLPSYANEVSGITMLALHRAIIQSSVIKDNILCLVMIAYTKHQETHLSECFRDIAG